MPAQLAAARRGDGSDRKARRRLKVLIAELREIEGWPNVYLHAAYLLADVLVCLDWPHRQIVAVLGCDPLGRTRLGAAVPSEAAR